MPRISPIFVAFLLLLSAWAEPYHELLNRPPPGVLSQDCLDNSGGDAASSSSGGNSDTDANNSTIAMSWYAGWDGTELNSPFTVEGILNSTWAKYDVLSYAFATTTSDVNTLLLTDSDKLQLPRFVQLARKNNVRAMITVGGWGGSQYFSTAVATASNRTAFVKTVLGLVSQYGLDGVDFDWEYPGKQGRGCNTESPDDSANFLSFLQALRADPAGQNITVSAAVGLTPFAGMSDVSAFAFVLDYIEIMDHDVWGSWSKYVGPNAPLNDSCAQSRYQMGSAVSAVKAWTAAGFPANQIVLGVASYGHGFFVSPNDAFAPGSTTQLVAYPPLQNTTAPQGDSWDTYSPSGCDQCGDYTDGGYSGLFNFWGLIQKGFLMGNGTVASGIAYRYDNCTQTPYVYDPKTQVMVSYDNAQSYGLFQA
ncbi:hypothetical protein AcV5_000182 [Taiwanofungus camphoratus]|nr:hypothetical protein AcV5_000182 [Antrodia cinnamomea]